MAATKGKGELAVRKVSRDAVIFRPSMIFGPEDDFFNRFAAMARISPIVPLVGASTRFQPVYVGDVAEAVARAVDGQVSPGKIYELGGPEQLTFRQCMELMLKEICRNRLLVNIPWVLASALGTLVGWLPFAPITRDQVEMLKTDNVVSDNATSENRTLEGLGILQHL